jgi:hypothetical protein
MIDQTLNPDQLALFADLQAELGAAAVVVKTAETFAEIAEVYRALAALVDEYGPQIEALASQE